MKKLIFLGIAVLLIVVFISRIQEQPRSGYLQTLQVGSQKLSVEIADTPEKIRLGLGEREELGSDGMLFVMPTRSIPTFWMKGMRFDLDFVWIDGTKVVDITQWVPAEPGVSPDKLKIYSPKSESTHVLEMNAGEVKRRGIQIGDVVSY